MENKNNKKSLYVIIAILCVLVLLLGGFIIYDKVLKNNPKQNETNNNTNQDNTPTEEESTNNWMDYILNNEINSIELTYCTDDPTNELGIPTKKSINITKNDLNKIFDEMKKGTIYKNYSVGLGGPCMGKINIDYTTNKKQYNLNLILYQLIDPDFTEDQKILSYLEDTNYTIKNYNNDININNEPYMFEYDYNIEIVNKLIEEYTK